MPRWSPMGLARFPFAAREADGVSDVTRNQARCWAYRGQSVSVNEKASASWRRYQLFSFALRVRSPVLAPCVLKLPLGFSQPKLDPAKMRERSQSFSLALIKASCSHIDDTERTDGEAPVVTDWSARIKTETSVAGNGGIFLKSRILAQIFDGEDMVLHDRVIAKCPAARRVGHVEANPGLEELPRRGQQ